MRVKSILSSTIVISILFIQLTSAAPPRYEIIDLGTLGGDLSCAYSINNSEQIVGVARTYLGDAHATLFDASGNGNNIDLGTLGGVISQAQSINDSGQIVGMAYNSLGFSRAALFAPTGSGNNTDLGTLGGMASWAWSINNSGQIVGCALNNSGYLRVVLFDNSGNANNIDLSTLGGLQGRAHCINNSGQIVGYAERSSGDWHASLFDPSGNGNNIDLGTLGGNHSEAWSINDSGHIVGTAKNSSGYDRAARFCHSESGNNIDLGTLGGSESCAYSINDSGHIVGTAQNSSGYWLATLFDATVGGNNIDLNILIDPATGWILKGARLINNRGWIVANGYNSEGEYHAFLMKPIPPKAIYVDDDAMGNNDGSSWADAYNYLQDALAAAWSGDEIRVAQGIYTPDSNSADPNGSGDRTATFHLINGVTIKGGYAGFGEPDPKIRDIKLYETILSGDLAGNDGLNFENNNENSYHVVTGSGTDPSAVLDGFTIIGGNANEGDISPHAKGGGVYNYNGSPTISNCNIIGNVADGWLRSFGGGMYNTMLSHPTLTNCIFSENLARIAGGAILNEEDSTPILTNCTFSRNSAFYAGGGICGSAILTNCILSENSASSGGGIRGSAILTNCILSGNSATEDGGAVKGDVTLINCTLIGNSAGENGGGIYWPSPPMPLPAGPNELSSTVIVESDITNCILWGNTPEQIYYFFARPNITYSNIQGSWIGEGNIDADPLFFDPGYWDTNDVWVDGDYHLLPDSPCIDAGDPNYLAEPNETDLDGNPRVFNGRIDMGAYEYVPMIPAEVDIDPNTLNLNSKGRWITAFIWLPIEYNVANIDPNSVILEGQIKPERFWLTEDNQIAIAKFNREEVQNIISIGEIELTITGRLTDGTALEGTDIIKVTDNAGGKSFK